jgi:DNA-binding NarL/FixJ family response regulator
LPPTPRQLEIERLLVDGLMQKEIAGQLGISLSTVDAHRRALYAKRGVRSRAELAKRYFTELFGARSAV